MDSMVVTGIGLAGFYWVCESFMYFFLEPQANFIQHVLGAGYVPDLDQAPGVMPVPHFRLSRPVHGQ